MFGETPDVANAEQGLRIMAMENRLHRRILGQALIGALQRAHQLKKDRFVRVVLPGELSADRQVAYVFLVLAYPTKIHLPDGYAQYRKVRVNTLHAYCLNVLADHRNLKRAVGIGLDASAEITGRPGSSEDMLVLEIDKWTENLERQAKELRAKLDILKPERLTRGGLTIREYPSPPIGKLSRQQRRALEREAKKDQRRKPLANNPDR